MRSILLLSLPLFVLASTVHADDKADEPIRFTLGWRTSLDAGGHVVKLDAIANARVDRVPEIRARLEQAIRQWQFIPGSVDDKPAATETGLYVRASLLPPDDSGNVRVRIDHASMGGTIAKNVVPRYPPTAVREHRTGEVVLRIAYDADGKVTSSELAPGAPTADVALVAASIKAASAWTFRPEVVGGRAVAGASFAPFCYSLGNSTSKCDWTPPGEHQAIDEGEAFALNPAVRLVTDVAGHTL